MGNENQQKQQEKKEKPLNQLMTSHIADIYVGPESTHWPIHERLLCYHSPFFANVFYKDDKDSSKKSRGNHSYGLPDQDDYPFELLVGWLYSKAIRQPKLEKDLGPLLDLYLLAEKFEMKQLGEDVVEVVRDWYFTTGTYPGLRRVQFIYAETDEDNEMREMMVSSIARQLTTADKIPAHWASALQRNGQLAVDIIRSIQQWHLEARSIPDMRDGSERRGLVENGGAFSTIEREADGSMETADTNLGVESLNSDTEKTHNKSDDE